MGYKEKSGAPSAFDHLTVVYHMGQGGPGSSRHFRPNSERKFGKSCQNLGYTPVFGVSRMTFFGKSGVLVVFLTIFRQKKITLCGK